MQVIDDPVMHPGGDRFDAFAVPSHRIQMKIRHPISILKASSDLAKRPLFGK